MRCTPPRTVPNHRHRRLVYSSARAVPRASTRIELPAVSQNFVNSKQIGVVGKAPFVFEASFKTTTHRTDAMSSRRRRRRDSFKGISIRSPHSRSFATSFPQCINERSHRSVLWRGDDETLPIAVGGWTDERTNVLCPPRIVVIIIDTFSTTDGRVRCHPSRQRKSSIHPSKRRETSSFGQCAHSFSSSASACCRLLVHALPSRLTRSVDDMHSSSPRFASFLYTFTTTFASFYRQTTTEGNERNVAVQNRAAGQSTPERLVDLTHVE